MAVDRTDKFLQPADAITIVSRAKGPRTLLTPEAIEDARIRIAGGEDPQDVAEELAMEELIFEEGLK